MDSDYFRSYSLRKPHKSNYVVIAQVSIASDPLLFRAAERSLLIISGAAKSLPAELTERYRQADWRKIADLGNVLRHDYNRVDPETIWNIVSDRIPDLAPLIEQMISDLIAE